MELLVVGDLHLGRSDGELRVPSLSRFDSVLLVGDLTDRGRAAAADDFLRALDAGSPPAYVVPGNHDWSVYTELVENYATVYDVDRRMRTLPDGRPLIGLGSRTFDEGPEVRTNVPGDEETPPWQRVGRQVRPGKSSSFPRAYRDWYCRRYARLLWLARRCDSAPIIVSHPPAYGTEIDRMRPTTDTDGQNWGSLALRQFLAGNDVRFLACGHIHEAVGREEVDGTPVLNAGYRTNWHVRIDETVEIVGRVPSGD